TFPFDALPLSAPANALSLIQTLPVPVEKDPAMPRNNGNNLQQRPDALLDPALQDSVPAPPPAKRRRSADSDDDDDGKQEIGRERRKIEIKFIEDKGRRHITFSKRKAGIMKKAYELSVLTGTQVLLLVVSETGLVYTFTTPKLQPIVTKSEGKNLIQTCLNAPEDGQQDDLEQVHQAHATHAAHVQQQISTHIPPPGLNSWPDQAAAYQAYISGHHDSHRPNNLPSIHHQGDEGDKLSV
ncbi:Transcription factor of morphogenesis MCM1, partial [Neolecta irregularis DAH-3]